MSFGKKDKNLLKKTISATFLTLLSLTTLTNEALSYDYCKHGNKEKIIFLDRTTAYDEQDKELLVSGLDYIVQNLNTGDKVTAYTIVGDSANISRSFHQCVPGCPESGFLSWFNSSCKNLEAKADLKNFKSTLAKKLRQLLNDTQQFDKSDIARSVSKVTQARHQLSKDNTTASELESVYIFSDLLENSELLPWPSILQNSSQSSVSMLQDHDVHPIFNEARVFVFGVGRLHDEGRTPLGPKKEKLLKDFWRLYFSTGGASEIFIGQDLN